MTTVNFDVIVVGLGPAGASAALAATSDKYNVLAVDRRSEPGSPVQCAELVPALISQDIPNLNEHIVQSIQEMRTSIEGGSITKTNPFPGHIVDRGSLDKALVDSAINAGVDCRLGCPIAKVSKTFIELATKEKISAPVIIGADGPRSLVGRTMGQENKELIYAQQITVPLLRNYPSTDVFLSSSTLGGYSWFFPKNNVAHIGVGVLPCDRGELKTLISKIHNNLFSAKKVARKILNKTGGIIPAGGLLKSWQADKNHLALLTGDAAGLTNPITGAGIHAALVSGKLAGEAAKAWLDGDKSVGKRYNDDLHEMFGKSLARASRKKRSLLQAKPPIAKDFRNAWIAYPEYWS